MDITGIIIAVGAAAVVIFTIVYNIVRARQGKSSCGGCSGAGSGACSGCVKQKAQPKKSKKTR